MYLIEDSSASHMLKQVAIGPAATQGFWPLTQKQRIAATNIPFGYSNLVDANNQTAMNTPKRIRI
jgi:hypothetical protein